MPAGEHSTACQAIRTGKSQSCAVCSVTQASLTLCHLMNYSPPGSSVHKGFSRQEYWSGLPHPPPGNPPNPGIKPRSPT